ncbi:MAG TPA: MFS transporter, partial [Gaiellaceae bacterium]|nr:MFS transporter [Gaiellaceae bacterium]
MTARGTNPWLVLVLVCLAQFMVVLDATIVNVALPSIQRDLAIEEADLQWIVNAYTLLFGGFLLLGGRAGDLLGRKRLFLAGLVVFTVASLVCGLAEQQEPAEEERVGVHDPLQVRLLDREVALDRGQ